jgi:tetratricopeptide (TPR) repeat protein
MPRHAFRLGALALALSATQAFAHGDAILGKVAFPISCNSEAAHFFEEGILLQYNYHWGPARKAFETAAGADAACGMAHYGIALTQMDNILAGSPTPKQLADGRAALAKAKAAGLPTQREKDFVAAADAFFEADEKQPSLQRMDTFAGAMKKVSASYPTDSEAGVIYAWALIASAPLTDQTYSKQLAAAAILEKIGDTQPEHPGVVHFLVHAYDYPAIAHKGVASARKYAKLAPSAPHALHMPSHIFTRMGYWQDSVDTNIASAKSCGDIEWCKLHAYDYMVYAYLQLGKVAEAEKIVSTMRDYALKQSNESRFPAAYALASAPLRVALETGQWKQAAEFTLPPTTMETWARVGSAEMIYAYGKGLGAARAGDVKVARAEIERLNAVEKRMLERGDKYWSGQSAIHAKTIEGMVAKAEGRNADAMRLLREAADAEDKTEKHIVTPGPLAPARELYAEVLLESGDAKGAYAAYVKTLEREPGRRKTLQGAAAAAEKAGDAGNAKKYREMTSSAGKPALVPVAAKADEVDPCPCRYCRET